jgi:ankyrin repeat protein
MSNNSLIKNGIFKNDNLYSKLFEKKDINDRDEKGRNALFWAMYDKDYKLIEFLIKKGIDLNVTGTLSAMNYAVYKDDVKLIKHLRTCGLDINELDIIKSTPLIYAVLYNKLKSINYLVNNGAFVFCSDTLGNSAFTLASDLKIQYLIDKFNNISLNTK